MQKLNTGAPDVQKTFSLASVMKSGQGVQLILLILKDDKGNLISHNTYWLEAGHNYQSLQNMPAASVAVSLIESKKDGEQSFIGKLNSPIRVHRLHSLYIQLY